jgi:membrane protease YdiL (CAAX protease family)
MDATIPKRDNTILICGVIIAFLFFPVIGRLVFLGQTPNLSTLFYSRLIIWLEVIILFFYAKWIEKDKFLLWPEKSYGFWFYPASFGALLLLKIGVGTIAVIPRLLGWHDNQQVVTLMFTILSKSMPLMAFTMITAGITEELIFRAYLVPRLELLFNNKYMPVILSSLMFSSIHYRYFSVGEIIFTFCFGIVFAIHYQWYRNIKILIVAHAIFDLISFSVFKLAQIYHLQPHS